MRIANINKTTENHRQTETIRRLKGETIKASDRQTKRKQSRCTINTYVIPWFWIRKFVQSFQCNVLEMNIYRTILYEANLNAGMTSW